MMVIRDSASITVLYAGAHRPDSKFCLLEAVAYVAGEPWSDHPTCVSPVLAAFGRAWNDGMRSDEERAQLLPYIPLLIGTRASPEVESRRAYMALDWLVRVNAPAWLRLAKLETHAVALETLLPLVDPVSVEDAVSLTRGAARAAGADEAAGAAWAAGAARAARADGAARAALEPTVLALQADAHRLFREMIACR